MELDLAASGSEAEEILEDEDAPGAGTWEVSHSRKNWCLHVIGRCHRSPGVHYMNWRVVKDPPDAKTYNKVCMLCFPLGYPVQRARLPETSEKELADRIPAEIAEEIGTDSSSSSESS